MPAIDEHGVADPNPDDVEKSSAPPTEAERKQLHFAVVEKEGDDARYKRRDAEYKGLLATHWENINNAHASYPTRSILWEDMDEDEQRRWNEKRKVIDSANRAYHLAVNRTFNGHAEENAHLARVAAAKQTKGDI
jgi:hypothetical protein